MKLFRGCLLKQLLLRYLIDRWRNDDAFVVKILLEYCKTLNVSVPFISRISRAKQNREIKGREYQLQAKIGWN